VQRLSGAFVESKAGSVAFHYRRANPLAALDMLGALRSELQHTLGPDVHVLDGHKVLELRQSGVSKNVAVEIALAHAREDSVVLAAGDDRTDEDMFAALPAGALSIRVGTGTSAARLRVESSRALIGLLSRLI
jgi:trehalose 6-phosphate synthase/phosphatase